MHILVTGATGFVGSSIIRALLDEGHRVTVCARNEKRAKQLFPDCDYTPCNYVKDTNTQVWLPRLKNIDIVINTVGIIKEEKSQTFENLHTKTPIALFEACEQAGVKRIIQISAIGADETAVTRYHKTKKQADDILHSLEISSIILRPSILYGEGGTSWKFFQALSQLPIIPMIGKGEAIIQPVHIDDLVKAVLSSINLQGEPKLEIDLVSEQPVTLSDFLTSIRKWLGSGKMRSMNMSYGLAGQLSKLSFFSKDLPLNKDTIVMLKSSKAYSVQECKDALGFIPLGFEEKLKTMHPTSSQKQAARFFFLEYALIWSLAIMWIWTAITSAFLYPVDKSYELLAATGLTGQYATTALFGASALDFLIGIALMFRFQLRVFCWFQIALILTYTAILSVAIPDLWLHPFGPLTKNIPILAVILVVLAFQEKKNV